MSNQIVSDLPRGAAQMADLIGLLGEAAVAAAAAASRATFRAIDARSGGKPLPNAGSLSASEAGDSSPTPLWDVLVKALDQALQQPGSRARVARYVGVPRQRITDYTKGRRSPDAETTLRLLHWLAATRAGHDPSFIVPPAPSTDASAQS